MSPTMTLGAAKNRLKRCVRWDLFVAYYHFLMSESLNNSFGCIWEPSRLFYLCLKLSVFTLSIQSLVSLSVKSLQESTLYGAALHIILSLG
jgi:hypothetical protein